MIVTRLSNFLRNCCLFSMLAFFLVATFSLALVEITFFIALIAWVIYKLHTRTLAQNILSRRVLLPLLGYLVLMMLSYFWSEYPKQSFRGVFKILEQFMIFWMVGDIFRADSDFKWFDRILLATAGLVLADSAFQYFSGFDFLRHFEAEHSSAGIRLSAGFHTYGGLAAFLVAVLPLLAAWGYFYRKEYRDRFKTFLYWGFFLCGLVVLFLTRSRGAFLAFIGGCFFILLFKHKWKTILLLGVLLAGFLAVLPKGMVIHLDKDGKEQSLVERFYLWDRAAHVIRAKPWTGTGINTYTVAHAKYDATQSWRVKGYYAHNGYLQIAAETGLPSLIFLLTFFLLYYLESLKLIGALHNPAARNLQWGVLVGILNFIFLGVVDTVLHNPQPVSIFWYLLGFQWASLRRFVQKNQA